MNYNDFSCPVCKHRLKHDDEVLSCECGNKYYLIDEVPDFLFENKNETEMNHYFNSVSNYYESTPYLSKLYSFFGGIFTYPPEIIVPIINKSIDDGLKSILNPKGRLILDVACGTGLFTRNLAKHTHHTWGIDISMEMLKQGYVNIRNENLNNITLARADVYELPFPNSMFHGVSCIGAMQLFTDLDHALAEINRVIMDGGSMAVVTYINRGKWTDNDYQNYLKKLDIHFFDIDEIEEHLEKNGFNNFKYTINGSMIFFACTADKDY